MNSVERLLDFDPAYDVGARTVEVAAFALIEPARTRIVGEHPEHRALVIVLAEPADRRGHQVVRRAAAPVLWENVDRVQLRDVLLATGGTGRCEPDDFLADDGDPDVRSCLEPLLRLRFALVHRK